MNTVSKNTYNLNLSDRYVPNWGAWEVAREIICNAIDADRDGMRIESLAGNKIRVTTKTSPTLSDIFVIGGGSKQMNGDDIGQFGEGMKMAALVACRDGQGMTVHIPGHKISFEFRDVMGSSVLHGVIEDDQSLKSGSVFEVTMPHIGNAYAGKIMLDSDEGPFNPGSKSSTVYCKGVFIGQLSGDYLWSWNLRSLEVNRDRSMVDTQSLSTSTSEWLGKNMTREIADLLIEHPFCLEANNHGVYINLTDPEKKSMLQEAFYRKHGVNAVLAAMDDAVNGAVESSGVSVVRVGWGWFENILINVGIKKAAVSNGGFDFEAVSSSRYMIQIEELNALRLAVHGPTYILKVFSNRSSQFLGFADMDERVIWLKEDLFAPGNEASLRGTFLHELAHMASGAKDCSRQFEDAMTRFMGHLAVKGVGI